ncbi:MAG: redoxin domain-containing protein [Bacteroidales bacterium]|nr:redoxin domain-containing protein [Bacteroidales bacterium]MBN2820134.1 redoxin domain-containing protein [Bacteroidales bacterium]
MKVFHLKYAILLTFLYSSSVVFSQIITIKSKIFSYQKITLAYHFGDGIYKLNEITLNEDGFGVFQSDEYSSGIYYLFLNDSLSFPFLIDKDFPGKISISEGTKEIFNIKDAPSPTLLYNKYCESLDSLNKKQGAKLLTDEDGLLLNEYKLAKDSVIKKYIEYNTSSFFENLLKAQLSIEIPALEATDNSQLSDSAIWDYKITYYKKHYLDNVEFSDYRLIRSPVYTQKIDTYLSQITMQTSHAKIKAIDYLINKASNDTTTQRFMINYLLKKFSKQDNSALGEYCYLHIIENYYLKNSQPWVSNNDLKLLTLEYNRQKPAALYSEAPEFLLSNEMDDKINLNDTDAEFIILYFYNYECPLCDRITPELNKILSRYNYLDVNLITICLGSNSEVWKTYIKEKNLSHYTNVIVAEDDNSVALKYNLSYTPTFFLLDKEKKIINKNYTLPELENFLLNTALSKHK